MVASSQPLATAAGLQVLQQGGNAADAAVATAAALNVTEPNMTGIGGDCFALYYEAATGRVTALNGSGRAPAGLSLERLAGEGIRDALPEHHAHTVTVPGEPTFTGSTRLPNTIGSGTMPSSTVTFEPEPMMPEYGPVPAVPESEPGLFDEFVIVRIV